jgi:cob(I)alamin adenosyltransferase
MPRSLDKLGMTAASLALRRSRRRIIFLAMNDESTTSLPGGLRVRKSDALFDALGSLDELNAALGLLRAQLAGHADAALVETIQQHILQIGSELATGNPQLDSAATAALELEIEKRNAALPPLHHFVLPGASEPDARAHGARAVCRRAEREVIRIQESHPARVSAAAIPYLNRLSVLLFVLARSLADP